MSVSYQFRFPNICLSWDGVAGTTYEVQGASALVNPQWSVVRTITPTSDGRITECVDLTQGNFFFRVSAFTPPPPPPVEDPWGWDWNESSDDYPFDGFTNRQLYSYDGTIDDPHGGNITTASIIFFKKTPEGNLTFISVSSAGNNISDADIRLLVNSASEFNPNIYSPLTDDNGKVINVGTLQRRFDMRVRDGFGDGSGVSARINQSAIDRWPVDVKRTLAYWADKGIHKHLKNLNENIDSIKAREGVIIQGRRLTALHTSLVNDRRIPRSQRIRVAHPFLTGAVLFALWNNSDAIAQQFESAFRDYALDLQRGRDTTGSVAILAGVCNNLAIGSGNIVLDALLQ